MFRPITSIIKFWHLSSYNMHKPHVDVATSTRGLCILYITLISRKLSKTDDSHIFIVVFLTEFTLSCKLNCITPIFSKWVEFQYNCNVFSERFCNKTCFIRYIIAVSTVTTLRTDRPKSYTFFFPIAAKEFFFFKTSRSSLGLSHSLGDPFGWGNSDKLLKLTTHLH